MKKYREFMNCSQKIGCWCLSLGFITIWLNTMRFYNIIGHALFPCFSVFFFFVGLLRKKGKRDCISILFFLVLGELFFSSIISLIRNYELHYGQLCSYFLMLLLCFLLHQQDLTVKDIREILFSVMIGAIIIAFLIIVLRTQYFEDDNTRLTILTRKGELVDPNFIGSILSTALSVGLFFLLEKRKNIVLIAVLILGFSVFLTGSRGAMLYCMITGTGFMLELMIRFKKTARNIFLFFIVIFCLLPIGSLFLFHRYYDSFARLFLNLSAYTSDASNLHRLELWKNGLELFLRNPFLGQGIAREELMFERILNLQNQTAHNTWLTLVNQLGLLGFIIYISPLIYMLLSFCSKRKIMLAAMLLGYLLNVTIISAPISYVFWLPYIVCILLLDYTKLESGCTKTEKEKAV